MMDRWAWRGVCARGGEVGRVSMSVGGLAELGEHAKGGFGMEEGDEFVSGTREGHLMDEPGTLLLGVRELTGDVVGGKRDVVNARAVFFEEFGDWALVGGGFEQFDVDVSGGKKRGPDLLGFHFFPSFAGQAKHIFVVGDGFVE